MRFLSFLLLFFSFGFGFETYKSPIINIENSTGVIKDSSKIFINSGGIIIHKIKNDELIIARASVVSKSNGFAKIQFSKFSDLNQDGLPSIDFDPQKGDEVILNHLYDRALLIAPNEEVFKEVKDTFEDTSFIHPDIVAQFLQKNDKPQPKLEDFSKICIENSAGLIFLAKKNKSFIFDCHNSKSIDSFKGFNVNEYSKPFYTRIKDISGLFGKLRDAVVKDYEAYYSNLFNQE